METATMTTPRSTAGRWCAAASRRCWPGFGRLAACLSFLALVSLSFVAGEAAMYFGLPTSAFASKAFTGAVDWFEMRDARAWNQTGLSPQTAVILDQPKSTADGYTLITLHTAPEALLLDMNGKVVHQWKMPNRRPWPHAAQVMEPDPVDPVHWEQCHLFANGDLLALCAASTPYGYGLAKFDKDSNLLWGYSANVHHDFAVGEDGRIYVLTATAHEEPPAGATTLPEHYTAESLVILSPKGRPLDEISLYEAFQTSPYCPALLSGLEQLRASQARSSATPMQPGNVQPLAKETLEDILHCNSVEVLSQALAPHFPQFREGMVLLSLRTSSLLAVLEPRTRSVVWAAQGPWRGQHSAQFLDNGHLLLFDNTGSARGARVLEYDPVTQAIPWWYPGDKDPAFQAPLRGRCQRLANGNTLIFTPGQRIFEVNSNKEIVWDMGDDPAITLPVAERWKDHGFAGAKRYAPGDLTFLKPDQAPRP
jgi:hypothetical protein